MKKSLAVIIAVFMLSCPVMSFAQMEKKEGMMDDKAMPMMGHGMMKGDMMEKGDMMDCPMKKSMMMPRFIATSDGGIVVVTGHTMTKYDQDLDVIGQADIKMDMEEIKKMKAGCPCKLVLAS